MPPSTIDASPQKYRIASIPGDGIGLEVIDAGIQVLEKLASVLGQFELEFDHIEWSSAYYKKYGKYIPDDGLATLKKYDAIYFGSVGAPGTFCLPKPTHPVNHHHQSQILTESPTQMSQTISPSGASASQSAKRYNNTPTCAPQKSSEASTPPSKTAPQAL